DRGDDRGRQGARRRARARPVPAAPLFADGASRSRVRAGARERRCRLRRGRLSGAGGTASGSHREADRRRAVARAPRHARGVGARSRGRSAAARVMVAAGRHPRDARRGRRRPCGRGAARSGGVRVEEGVRLSRYTTLGTGGPAGALARPETLAELEQALAWAAERELAVATVGLGSNLLVADDGVDALVLKLGGELGTAEVRGELLVAGGGASNAVALHRARAAGLGGFEFACAIPGTAGGGVWMNAGAYGGEWAAIVERALVVTAEGSGWRTPAELGMRYRHSELGHGQVVAQVE